MPKLPFAYEPPRQLLVDRIHLLELAIRDALLHHVEPTGPVRTKHCSCPTCSTLRRAIGAGALEHQAQIEHLRAASRTTAEWPPFTTLDADRRDHPEIPDPTARLPDPTQ